MKSNPSQYSSIRERYRSESANYELLRGDNQAVKEMTSVWDDDYVREKYIQYTDKIVGVLDGSIEDRDLPDTDNKEASKTAADSVIWLDKSARPVAWFVDAFWDRFAKEGVDKPSDEFLNIDRVNWFMRQGYSEADAESILGPKDFDINKVSDEDIARIRAIFVEGEIDPDNWQKSVWELPTRLDGQNIVIVDEVKNKGGTLAIAQQLVKRAIPTATVSGEYFWQSGTYAMGGDASRLQMMSAPLWYSSIDAYGRGVGDISKSYYERLPDTTENRGRKLGWIALSAPHYNPKTFKLLDDPKAKRLMQDIAYMTYDSIYRRPDADRDFDDIDNILESQGVTPSDHANYIRQREQENKVR